MIINHMRDLAASSRRLLGRLRANQGGNVTMIMGFAVIPLTFLVGMGVDYARAEKLQTRLNAAADAAALAAVDPSMILQSDDAAVQAARNMFNSQIADLSDLVTITMTPTIVDGTSGSGSLGFRRKVTIAYQGTSRNLFSGLLGMATLPVSGSSAASAEQPPNINFYLAMDDSPSMLLPATSAGLTAITPEAPSPWTTRATISIGSESERAQPSEARVKIARPIQ